MYREELKRLIRKYLYVGKTHVLSSKKTSSVYVDIKSLSLHPRGVFLLSKVISDMIPEDTSFIGGTELGAVMLTSLVQSYLIHVEDRNVSSFVIRKSEKQHGLRKEIECPYSLTGKIVLLEDVITTGATVLRAIQLVDPYKIICVVDRQEYSPEFEKFSHLIDPIFRLKDLI